MLGPPEYKQHSSLHNTIVTYLLTLCLLGILSGEDSSVFDSPFPPVMTVAVTAGGWCVAALLPDSDEALSTLIPLLARWAGNPWASCCQKKQQSKH